MLIGRGCQIGSSDKDIEREVRNNSQNIMDMAHLQNIARQGVFLMEIGIYYGDYEGGVSDKA
jgi:hypothetical protein